METIKIKTTVEIPESRVADLLCTAMEGGVGYWAQITGYRKPKELWRGKGWEGDVFRHVHYPMSRGGAMFLREYDGDEDPPPTWTVTRSKLIAGLRKMASDPRYLRHFADFMRENEDAITGDVFLQLSLFGEVVYG